jgi:hypothetical protein
MTGGVPQLPVGEEWPERPGRGPLSFVAAVDCEGLPREASALGFPERGTLLFFYFDGQVDDGDSVVFVDEPDSWAGVELRQRNPAFGLRVDPPVTPGHLPAQDRVCDLVVHRVLHRLRMASELVADLPAQAVQGVQELLHLSRPITRHT